MEAGTSQDQQPGSAPGGLTGAPPELERAAAGRVPSEDGERSVLDYLLGKTHRPESFVTVKLDTQDGLKDMRVYIRALHERKFEELDAANRDGDGPFSKLNRAAFDAAVVAEALIKLEDPESGSSVTADSPEFLGGVPSIPLAVEGRFRYQPGLIGQLAERVREISGYAPERVGTAQRVIKAAAGNSSGAED